jgi:hypothetical protein
MIAAAFIQLGKSGDTHDLRDGSFSKADFAAGLRVIAQIDYDRSGSRLCKNTIGAKILSCSA